MTHCIAVSLSLFVPNCEHDSVRVLIIFLSEFFSLTFFSRLNHCFTFFFSFFFLSFFGYFLVCLLFVLCSLSCLCHQNSVVFHCFLCSLFFFLNFFLFLSLFFFLSFPPSFPNFFGLVTVSIFRSDECSFITRLSLGHAFPLSRSLPFSLCDDDDDDDEPLDSAIVRVNNVFGEYFPAKPREPKLPGSFF